MKYELSHARIDPSHCLAPGLFRSLMKGERKKRKLDIVYQFNSSQRIEFSGPEPLDDLDLRVLQGLVAMAGLSGGLLDIHHPKTPTGKELSAALEPTGAGLFEDALAIEGSFYKLAKEIGYKNPGSTRTIKDMRDSIERLWKVSIIVRDGSATRGFRLLADNLSSESKGFYVALNPMIAQAALGAGRRYSKISMAEIRALKTAPARLIHFRLCGFIDPKKEHPTLISVDTLCGYVWPDPTSGRALNKRREKAKLGLLELSDLGWSINEISKNKFKIARPI